MQAARLIGAPVALLAACVAFAFVPAVGRDGDKGPDQARLRAEALADAASRRFSEVLKEERIAQAQSTQPSARPAAKDKSADDPWSAGLQWLEHSNREFQTIIRRLSQSSGTGADAPGRPSTPPAKSATSPPAAPPAPPARVESKPAPAEPSGTDWLTRSSERFQSLMRRLAEGAAPPIGEPATKADKGWTRAHPRLPRRHRRRQRRCLRRNRKRPCHRA